MTLNQIAILLPCVSLEDFPLQQPADQADQLLSAYSALWHPTLVAHAQATPTWLPAEQPPEEPAGHLITLPECSEPFVPDNWPQQAREAGAAVLSGFRHRREFVVAALEQIGAPPSDLDPELVADFQALGFCHLHVELLTRQLRYMSNLDEESFGTELLAAAEEAVKGDPEAARHRLHTAFELLQESREYFYPVESHLVDLALVAPTTLGEALRAELADKTPKNLLVSGEVIQEMARREPATLEALKKALEQDTVALIGGEFSEAELPLLPPEAIAGLLRRGLAVYREHLNVRPVVFGRRRYGLTPVLPQILEKLGFDGVLHCTLDDGRFPVGNQSRIRWGGVDGTTAESLGRVPLDAGRADAFLRLPERLGDSMDLDHVATLVLAHWPGRSCRWFGDLKRIAGYSSVLGTFATVGSYFENTHYAGEQADYKADQYRSPYLQQEVAAGHPDPISRWVRYFRRRAMAESIESLDTLTAAAGGLAPEATDTAQLLVQVDESPGNESQDLHQRLKTALEESVARFAESIVGCDSSDKRGYLLTNPLSFSRRVCIETPDLATPPDVGGAVRAVGQGLATVDVPAMGFAWVGAGSKTTQGTEPQRPKRRGFRKAKAEPPLADGNVLQNEFFKITIDPYTGAIRSIHDYYSRDARLAQQIALRMPEAASGEDDYDRQYSIMAADEVKVTSSGPIVGEIVCRGRLVDREARRLAAYTQLTRVRRGSRIIDLEIELDVDRQPGSNPWDSYYAVRFAWNDATANLYRSVNLANLPTDVNRLEAPHFVDVRAGKMRTTLLAGGLPYHRRFGLRKLDTLLVVRGETARRFRLGIGIDLPHPMPAALGFLAPLTTVPASPRPPGPSGWLFHLDARNVLATHWEPLVPAGRFEGFRLRLLETDGRKVQLGLRAFRPIAEARKLMPGDAAPEELPIDGDRVTVSMRGHEWAEVEVRLA